MPDRGIKYSLLAAATSLIFIMGSCDEHMSGLQEYKNLPRLDHSFNTGCIGDSLVVIRSDEPTIVWSYTNDSLKLQLEYNANCCSEFTDSVAVSLPDAIAINLTDTTDQLCRCICRHSSGFSLYAPDISIIRISVAYNELDQPFKPLLDTILVVVPQPYTHW